MDPELVINALEQLIERAERGDSAASALLVGPPIIVLVGGGIVVVLAACEEWVRRKRGLR
jgi:hypothetical protein